jgi:hypothetical protein
MYCLYNFRSARYAQLSEKNPCPIPEEQEMGYLRESLENIEAMPTAVNYALLEEALTAFEAAKKILTTILSSTFLRKSFRDTRETTATPDCFIYNPSCQE